MQSGISASKELLAAFNDFVSSTNRVLIATIRSEQLVPENTLPSESPTFADDLSSLQSILKPNEALYLIIRRFDGPNGFVAVTYVPDSAPVRQKMIFASTRLTLVRELGIERFRETIFATTKQELSAEGFKAHDAHQKLEAPLTEEERELGRVKQAEAEEGRGMSVKKSHLSDHFNMPVADEAISALQALGAGEGSVNLVQLKINPSTEAVELAGTSTATPATLARALPTNEPRYSFFRHSYTGADGATSTPIIFIYTFPESSNRKERMMYASSRRAIIIMAEKEAGFTVEKKIESAEPEDVTDETIEEEFRPKVEVKQAFARPKRPGKR